MATKITSKPTLSSAPAKKKKGHTEKHKLAKNAKKAKKVASPKQRLIKH